MQKFSSFVYVSPHVASVNEPSRFQRDIAPLLGANVEDILREPHTLASLFGAVGAAALDAAMEVARSPFDVRIPVGDAHVIVAGHVESAPCCGVPSWVLVLMTRVDAANALSTLSDRGLVFRCPKCERCSADGVNFACFPEFVAQMRSQGVGTLSCVTSLTCRICTNRGGEGGQNRHSTTHTGVVVALPNEGFRHRIERALCGTKPVVRAASASVAVHAASSARLLIVDVVFGDEGGAAVARLARTSNPALRVIFAGKSSFFAPVADGDASSLFVTYEIGDVPLRSMLFGCIG